jgi:hypothetical protein
MLGAHPCVQDWLNEDRTAHAKHSFDERVATGNLNVPELTVEAVENSMGNIGHGLRFRLSEAVASNRNMVGKFYTSKYTDKGLARQLKIEWGYAEDLVKHVRMCEVPLNDLGAHHLSVDTKLWVDALHKVRAALAPPDAHVPLPMLETSRFGRPTSESSASSTSST